MDSVTITALATNAVNLLSPFFKQMTEGASKKFGEKIGEVAYLKTEQTVSLVKAKLHSSEPSKEAIEELVTNPDDEDTKATVRRYVKKAIESDEKFAQQLEALLKEVYTASGHVVINNTVQGNVEQQNVIGTNYGGISYQRDKKR